MPPVPPTIPKKPGEPAPTGWNIFTAILCTIIAAESYARKEIGWAVIFGIMAVLEMLILQGKWKYNEIISSSKK